MKRPGIALPWGLLRARLAEIEALVDDHDCLTGDQPACLMCQRLSALMTRWADENLGVPTDGDEDALNSMLQTIIGRALCEQEESVEPGLQWWALGTDDVCEIAAAALQPWIVAGLAAARQKALIEVAESVEALPSQRGPSRSGLGAESDAEPTRWMRTDTRIVTGAKSEAEQWSRRGAQVVPVPHHAAIGHTWPAEESQP